ATAPLPAHWRVQAQRRESAQAPAPEARPGAAGRWLALPPRAVPPPAHGLACAGTHRPDRKSTRLNSSHVKNSYAVFCLKKKKTKNVRKPSALPVTVSVYN